MLTREGKGDETKGDGEDGEIYKCGSCGRVEAWEKIVLAIRRRDRNSGHGSYGHLKPMFCSKFNGQTAC